MTACPVPSVGDRYPLDTLRLHVTHHPSGLRIYRRLLAVLARYPPDPSPATVADADAAQQLLIFELSQRAVQRGAISAKPLGQVRYVRPKRWAKLLQLHQHQQQLRAV